MLKQLQQNKTVGSKFNKFSKICLLAESDGEIMVVSVFSSFLKTTFAKKVLRRDHEIFFWDCQQQQQSFYIIFGKFLLQIEKRTKLLRFALK